MKNIYWYEVCFFNYGNEDLENEKSCSFVVKTEIKDIETAQKSVPEILLASFNNPYTANEYRKNLSGVYPISDAEARCFFDVDKLTKRVVDNLGIYYKRA